MRCLMCGIEKGDGDFIDILENDDPLCHACRNHLSKVKFHMKFHGHKLYAISVSISVVVVITIFWLYSLLFTKF